MGKFAASFCTDGHRSDALNRLSGDRVARRNGREGFTLVELLMTIAVMGLACGVVVIAASQQRPSIAPEAERLAARLSEARDEAILANRPVAVIIDARGYRFQSFAHGRWTSLSDGAFQPREWAPETELEPFREEIRATFDPTGAADPIALVLRRRETMRTVSVDGAGQVSLG